jgi:hypothetical protein
MFFPAKTTDPRLARTVGPQDRQRLTLAHVHRDAEENLKLAVGEVEILHAEQHVPGRRAVLGRSNAGSHADFHAGFRASGLVEEGHQ